MKKIIAYLFNHTHYNEVVSSYNKIWGQYSKAYSVWCEHCSFVDKTDFESKEYVVSHFSTIKELSIWMQISEKLLSKNRKAVAWLFPQIGENPTYEEIKKIAEAKESIISIDRKLKKAHYYSEKYCQAWNVFLNGKDLDVASIERMDVLTEDYFQIKEQFIQLFSTKKNVIQLILGVSDYPLYSFCAETYEKEKFILSYFFTDLDIPEKISFECSVDDETERKRLILGSTKYGDGVKFTDRYSINSFYKLRQQFDEIGVTFDHAVYVVKENKSAITQYNLEKSGNAVVYIENYLDAVTESTDLYKYIQDYQQVKQQRSEAKQIAINYPLGYAELFGTTDVDGCPLTTIDKIIENKSAIQEQDWKIRALQKAQEEAERKKRELENLQECISSWDSLIGGLKYSYLLNYYPTTCDFEATQSEWDDRWIVWNFKNSPGKTSETEHQKALDYVIPRLKEKLISTFGQTNLYKMTLVCIPASSQISTQRRYEEFSNRLCRETGLVNAFERIKVIHEKKEKHTGGTGIQTEHLFFDESFFKDKYIILFDDVITRGDSMRTFQSKMRSMGAIVIAGLSIGRTKHERSFANRGSRSAFYYDDLPF